MNEKITDNDSCQKIYEDLTVPSRHHIREFLQGTQIYDHVELTRQYREAKEIVRKEVAEIPRAEMFIQEVLLPTYNKYGRQIEL